MDKRYADTVRLLLAVAPEVFANDLFALKGGTAINLFVQDMPRLSVDLDVVFCPWQTPRKEALHRIDRELDAIAHRLAPLGIRTRRVHGKETDDAKLIVESDASQVKIEVNTVFRGAVLPVEQLSSRLTAAHRQFLVGLAHAPMRPICPPCAGSSTTWRPSASAGPATSPRRPQRSKRSCICLRQVYKNTS
jgi:predicted nucleotidyltransferase component of viral defense system